MSQVYYYHREVVRPYLIADDLLGLHPSGPSRYVIDFGNRDLFAAGKYKKPFAQVQQLVLPTREAAAQDEEERNRKVRLAHATARVNHHHANFFKTWWQLSYDRGELMAKLQTIPRYIACGQVTKRPIFEFVSSGINPNAALIVFPMADDYSFGVLQSSLHWEWFRARCSTLEERPRYTSDTVFDSFGWPQSPDRKACLSVAKAGRDLRALRRQVMEANDWSLRELYRQAELPGSNPLKVAQEKLDAAVRAAYSMSAEDEPLEWLLDLNRALAAREAAGQPVTTPGLPLGVGDSAAFFSDDCIPAPAF